jgi:hypothetical protein
MTKDDFWTLIETSRRGAKNVDDQMAKLHDLLVQLPTEDILGFDTCFQECTRDAYTQELWAAAYIVNGGCSDDGFDYFVGWLIAQGRKPFDAVLADPERLGAIAEPDDHVECERMWSAAAIAFEAKTGKDDFYQISKGVTRQLRGKPWDEETVDQLYPMLAQKFGM